MSDQKLTYDDVYNDLKTNLLGLPFYADRGPVIFPHDRSIHPDVLAVFQKYQYVSMSNIEPTNTVRYMFFCHGRVTIVVTNQGNSAVITDVIKG